MNIFKTFAASALIAISGGAASAAVIYADSVISSSSGGISDGIADSSVRTDVDNALGAPDSAFYSLGLGGEIVLGFGSLGTGAVRVWEVTFGNISRHIEEANVFALLGGAETFIGKIENMNAQTSSGGASLTYTGIFDSIKLVDVSPADGGSEDGFDVNAVGVSPVPLPATALLLVGGLAGLGALRRRKA